MWEPGTNYVNISHESKTVGYSEHVFWEIDAFWLDNNAEMKINFISYKCKTYFSLNSYRVYCQMHLYCAVLDQKIELVILQQHFGGFFPVCGNH